MPKPSRLALVLFAGLVPAALALGACSNGPGVELLGPPVPVVTVTATESVTEFAVAPVTEPAEPAEESSEPVAEEATTQADPDTGGWRVVDRERFRVPGTPGSYYFVSPSGNLYCAITSHGDELTAGCQAGSLVENLPQCDDPMVTSSPAIELYKYRGVGTESYCVSDGVFVYDGGAPTLEYGEQLAVDGIVCESESTGVTCYDEGSGRGFTAARAGFRPIG